MKAKYILEAITAMRAAENLSVSSDPREHGRILVDLMIARCALSAYSGLHDVEIDIEKDPARQFDIQAEVEKVNAAYGVKAPA